LIFDLDGTLVDSLPGIAAALNGALAEQGYPTHPEERVRTFIGNGTWMLAKRGLPAGATDNEVDSLEATFLRHYPETWREGTRIYDGILPMLSELEKTGLTLAIFSNKTHAFTVEMAGHLFGGVSFACVLGHRGGAARKPDPSGALEIAARMHLDPAQVGFVGDSTVDFETADNAGMPPYLVTWGYHPRARLEATGAPLAEDPPGLLRCLRGPHREA
jgi:phosphoglycolate phosphatase